MTIIGWSIVASGILGLAAGVVIGFHSGYNQATEHAQIFYKRWKPPED